MITNGYCELEELQSWNTATSAGAIAMLEMAIEAASRGIDKYCDRTFWQVTATARVLDACDSWHVSLGANYDLVSIDTNGLKTDENADGTFETTWAATDFQLLPLNAAAAPEPRPYRHIKAVGARVFPTPIPTGRVGRIQITGTWGWPAVPVDVKQACLLLAARLFIRKESPQGVAGFGEFGAIRVRSADPDVVALLEPYRRNAVLVA
jgi:hypothetical protein